MTDHSNINDGYLRGELLAAGGTCERCGLKTPCLKISVITLPEGVSIESTILFLRKTEAVISVLGIGCGDYAKFHRQIVHILGRATKGHAKKTMH